MDPNVDAQEPALAAQLNEAAVVKPANDDMEFKSTISSANSSKLLGPALFTSFHPPFFKHI